MMSIETARPDASAWRRRMRARYASLLVAGVLCFTVPGHAQRAAPGRIEGIVTDSVHETSLANALVLLARRTSDTTISASTLTDAKGRFAFDGLPAGSYVVALESALLDSLDLSVPPSTVAVAPGERTRIALAVPSGTTLRALACPGVALPADIGAMIGRVWNAATDRALGGATLTIGWSETTVDPATLRATNATEGAEVTTDSLGRFRICGVPTETYLDLRASLGGYRTVLLQVVAPAKAGVVRQDLSLSPVEGSIGSIAALDDSSATHRPAAPDVAMLSGTVYGTTAPLARVQIQRRGDSHVVSTDTLGHYRLGAVPIGTQVLELRRVGYLPRQLTLQVRPGETIAPDVHLTPVATLDSIRVVGERSRYREFDSRAKAESFGHFLRADDIARINPLLTSDLLRQMPGFRIVRPSTSDLDVKVVSSRGTTTLRPDTCTANIIIDGVPHQEINWIDPFSIGAMEIYSGTGTAPVQYRSPCGAIIIWTKRY